MATLRKRVGSWQAQVRVQGLPVQSRTFPLRSDAIAWARQVEAAAVRAGASNDLRGLRATTLANLLLRYAETVTVKKRGARQEGHRLRQMISHPLSSTPLAKLTAGSIAAYRDERLIVVQGPTVRRELVILRHVLHLARKEWGYALPSNPVAEIAIPKLSKPRERRLEGDEVSKVVLACDSSRSTFLGLIVRIAIETAMRRGEILAMRWVDIDWSKRTLRIPLTKNGDSRTIPLSAVAMALLSKIQMKATGAFVFSASANAVRLAWERAIKRSGIADLHFHDLRHEAISRFFEMGLSVPEVALISGHKDYRMLARYTHLRAEDVASKLWAGSEPQPASPLTAGQPVARAGNVIALTRASK